MKNTKELASTDTAQVSFTLKVWERNILKTSARLDFLTDAAYMKKLIREDAMRKNIYQDMSPKY